MAACGQLVGQVNDKTRKKERAENKLKIKTKEKNWKLTVFPTSYQRNGSFQESTLVHSGQDPGCKNSKLRMAS